MKLDDVKKLHQKKYRQSLGHFLVEGEHLVLELEKAAAANTHWHQAQLFVTSAYQDWPSTWPRHLISDRQMAQLSDTRTPQGILAVAPLPPAGNNTSSPAGKKAVYLHEVQDPGNLGTILRTLAWFGGFRCLLSPGSVDPWNPKVVRSSMGAIFHVPVETEVTLDTVTSRYPHIACLDTGGEAITSPDFRNHECYLFGNEARGIPTEALNGLGAGRFTIPGAAAIESLNLASAVNMAIYELNRVKAQ